MSCITVRFHKEKMVLNMLSPEWEVNFAFTILCLSLYHAFAIVSFVEMITAAEYHERLIRLMTVANMLG